MADYVRSSTNISATVDSNALLKRYKNMLNNVTKMINTDGYTYSVWIYFQIGLKDGIMFNTASTKSKQNLIASLNINKNGSGVANDFTLDIQYDPFNYGQDTTDAIDKLETFIASAMGEDFDDINACRGKLQYGYNSTSDSNLVSPLYEFFLTSASTDVKFDSGIVSYTFTGTSVIAADCDFTASFPAVEKASLLQVVANTLYKYYGDPKHKPDFVSDDVEPDDNDYKYRIDIAKKLINDSPEISYEEVKSATMSPLMYCKKLLEANPLTAKEKASGDFDDIDESSVNLRPRWVISITDHNNAKTIHITHAAPKSSKNENGKEVYLDTGTSLSLDYTFTWGTRSKSNEVFKSIVVGWHPEVDLYTYLIRKALSKRQKLLKELADTDTNENSEYKKQYDAIMSYDSEILEMYNAEIQLVGIPADPPMTAEVTVIPMILESKSRTAGIYMITGASDTISTQGTYVSSLKLFRLRNTDAKRKKVEAKATSNKNKNTNNNTNNNNTYTKSTAPVGFNGPVLPDAGTPQANSSTYVRTTQPSEIQKMANPVNTDKVKQSIDYIKSTPEFAKLTKEQQETLISRIEKGETTTGIKLLYNVGK